MLCKLKALILGFKVTPHDPPTSAVILASDNVGRSEDRHPTSAKSMACSGVTRAGVTRGAIEGVIPIFPEKTDDLF